MFTTHPDFCSDAMGKYEDTILHVFDNKRSEGFSVDEEIPFDRDDIEDALDELGITVKNVPDIPYAYRSRRALPDHIEQHGYNAIILDDSIEGADATYLFTKEEQLIHIPDEYDETHRTSLAELPDPVQEYIGKDEQGVLTQVRYAGLLDDFTGMDTYHLQSHMRFRVNSREAELDDLYIGVDEDGNDHAVAVEAKGVGETLNKNQLIRNTRGIEQKSAYPNRVETLAVKLDEDGYFYLFEFDVDKVDGENHVKMERVWQYEFSEETTEEATLEDY
jgi:hypothetical protein